jgi:hypothetical protein
MSGWDERDDIDRDVDAVQDEHGVTYRLDGEGPAWDYADLGRCDL